MPDFPHGSPAFFFPPSLSLIEILIVIVILIVIPTIRPTHLKLDYDYEREIKVTKGPSPLLQSKFRILDVSRPIFTQAMPIMAGDKQGPTPDLS
jgi:hypothetical protein